ncbi:Odorant receptor 38 [Blattella germanica]|nr:Odorant receptor 38 [Blattella germanica]
MLEALFDNSPPQVADIDEMESHELGLMNVVRLELCIVGLIPTNGIVNDRWKLKLFRYYQNVMICVYIPVMLGQLMAIQHFWGDLDTVTDCAGMFSVFVACFFDYLYLIEHEKTILHVCEVLEETPIPKVKNPRLIEKYLAIVEICRTEIRIVMEIFWGLAAIGAIKWLLYNPIENLIIDRHFLNHTLKEDKPNADFVFIIWFPFDATWSPLFEIIYMFQSILLVMATCHNICANSTFLTFMVHAWGKLEFVECTVSSIDDELNPKRVGDEAVEDKISEIFGEFDDEDTIPAADDTNDDDTTVTLEEEAEQETGLNGDLQVFSPEGANTNSDVVPVENGVEVAMDAHVEYLKRCVKQHQDAIDFVHELDDLVSTWLAVRMFAFQMVAAGEVFQLIVNMDDWEKLVGHGTILFFIFAQILIYCWFGEQILQGGWDVDRAVYETPWFTYSQTYRKNLILIIMRAQRPVEVTVGHYYSLSLQSCELILQNIYFFSMFLNQINNKASKQAALAELEAF